LQDGQSDERGRHQELIRRWIQVSAQSGPLAEKPGQSPIYGIGRGGCDEDSDGPSIALMDQKENKGNN
jgi:hypothetical protein